MQQTMAYQGSGRPAGLAAIVSALPLWLFSIAILVEGFPRPPVSGEVAMASFVAALGLTGLALWKRWMTVELSLHQPQALAAPLGGRPTPRRRPDSPMSCRFHRTRHRPNLQPLRKPRSIRRSSGA